jgi:glycosyltransferase involved in cell wall biosynthesis
MISVIVPVYNHADFIADALSSIRAQTCRPAEVVVVDDGSEDGSAARAEAAHVRVLREPHGGLARALNVAMAATTGPLVAFLDADDLWMPDKLERQVVALADNDAVFGWVEEFSALDVRCRRMPGYLKGTMLVRRTLLDRVGPFDESLGKGDFVDWFVRAQHAGMRHLMLDHVVLRRRVHAANLAAHRVPDQRDYLRVLKQALDRRRA